MKFHKHIKEHLSLLKAHDIVRRYFIMNFFDGSLTTLGILSGAYFTNLNNIQMIIGATLGAGIAMFIAGLSGAYLSESAERKHQLRDLERAMLKNLEKSTIGQASKFVPIYTSIVDGISPLLASFVIILPFLFSHVFNDIDIKILFYISFAICFSLIFTLGLLLGKLSKENIFYGGIKALLIGIITAVIISLIGKI